MAIKCAVIGAGYIGREHIKGYRSWPDAELVAVAETDERRANEVVKEFDVHTYAT